MADVKLSAIAAGGTVDAATDALVAVRSGTTDVLVSVGSLASQSGTFSGTSSGTNTGDQTIILTGDVTGSGTGSFSTAVKNNLKLGTVGFNSIDSTAVATGQAGAYIVCPYAGSITAWNFAVDAGTATVKVWKIAAGTASPTSANSINTSGVSIASGTAVRSTTLTDFTTTAVAANDIFAFSIEAVSGVKKIAFQLEITKT